jgi:DNA-binding LytR/AlgR family response regulator
MKIGICDDDSLFLKLMTKYVKQYEKENCKEFKIIQFINEDRLVEYLKKDPEIDILFLDVLLYQKNGMLKPFNYSEFADKMNDLMTRINTRSTEVFYDNTDKGKILIDVDDLIYIETCERNTKIHTREDTYISSKKMKEHERLLQGYTFCRCHASYIVNLSYVRSIDGLSLFLKDGTEIQISKSRRGKFMEAFAKYVDSVIRF